jgi:hypothetical protein
MRDDYPKNPILENKRIILLVTPCNVGISENLFTEQGL